MNYTCTECGMTAEIDPDESDAQLYANEEHAALHPGHNPQWADADGNDPGDRA